VSPTLAEAMHADLVEVLGEFQIHPEALSGEAAIDRAMAALAKELPVVVAGSDLLNPAPSLVEGMLEPLEEFAVVLIPGFGGECLAASLNPMAEWTREAVAMVVAAVESGTPDVGMLTQGLVQLPAEVFCQMPWYRGSDAVGRECCRAHMRALAASHDEDFLAHRTQVVLDSIV